MSSINQAEGSINDSGEACAEANSSELVLRSKEESVQVFSNISASGHSCQLLGNVYNTTNINYPDSDDADAKRVIDSLYFSDTNKRQGLIGRPAADTFEWLLQPESVTAEAVAQAWLSTAAENQSQRLRVRQDAAARLTNWLRAGDGLFWIVGKAASGKSTLMKFLRNHRPANQLLDSWASGSRIVIADHYFWHTGSDLQKSHEGVYRSLLWQIFRSDPGLVRTAWPLRFGTSHLESSPSGKEFNEAIANVAAQGIRLCLYIDGLDEYHPQGDLDLLLGTLIDLAKLPNIKICVSCRPWLVFEEEISNTRNKIQMEDINWIDIERYALTTIRRHLRRSTLESDFKDSLSPDGAHFINQFVHKSQGVFLWAHLALQRLAPRIRFATSITEVEAILDQFPSELESYFKNLIFERINSTWKESETAAILMFRLAGCKDLCEYWPCISVHGLRNAHFGFAQDICYFPDSWFGTQFRMVADLINQCCTDLLAVRPLWEKPGHGDITNYRLWRHSSVDYTHRTIYDFLESEYMTELLGTYTPQHFQNRSRLFLQARLTVLKMMPPKNSPREDGCEFVIKQSESLTFSELPKDEDHKVVEECERALVQLVKHRLKDTHTKNEISYKGVLDGRDFHPMLWRCAFSGLYGLANELAEFGYLSEQCRVIIIEGSLGVGGNETIQGSVPYVPYRPSEVDDVMFPLSKLSVSSIKTALTFGKGPNDRARVDYPWEPSSRKVHAHTIWHEFLFKWWRIDPRREWGWYNSFRRSESNPGFLVITNPKIPESLQERRREVEGRENIMVLVEGSELFRKPENSIPGRLRDLAEPETTIGWEIAKILIKAGADLREPVCLVEGPHPDILKEDWGFGGGLEGSESEDFSEDEEGQDHSEHEQVLNRSELDDVNDHHLNEEAIDYQEDRGVENNQELEENKTQEEGGRPLRTPTIDAYWKVNVGEVLWALVPESALEELQQLLTEANEQV